MSLVKKLKVKVIKKPAADRIMKKYHYSGKVVPNSQINFGIFLEDRLIGAAQFGPSINKRLMGMSLGIGMNESIELNRLAISDVAGKNTESRIIGICLRMIKKNYPFIRCVISFSDACRCGDGIIYRASNFKLLSYKANDSLIRLSKEDKELVSTYIPLVGDIVATNTLGHHKNNRGVGLSALLKSSCPVVGYQMKYIYYFDKELEKKHDHVEFDNIPDEVRMYKGKKYAVEA